MIHFLINLAFPTREVFSSLVFSFGCASGVVYNEARGESFEGQIAVAEVIRNRNKGDVCHTVSIPYQFATMELKRPVDEQAYRKAQAAVIISFVFKSNVSRNAKFFHTFDTKPYWSTDEGYRLGRHLFYAEARR